MKKHLIVDFGSISYWKLFAIAAKSQNNYPGLDRNTIMKMESDKGFPSWKVDVDYSLLQLIDKFNPDILTIACDGDKIWRKNIYPEYKANRKKNRAEIPIDWNKFFALRNEYINNISNFLPIKTLLIDNAEADDIIAVLTKKLLKEDQEVIAVTVDSDIHQLYKYPNFKCYDPRKDQMVSMNDPTNYLLVKVMSGDTGDNIKPLRPRLGPATAQKIINETNGDVADYCKKNNLLESLQLNQRLINFEFIPMEIEDSIVNFYENTEIKKINALKIPMYFGDAYSTVLKLMKGKLYHQNDDIVVKK